MSTAPKTALVAVCCLTFLFAGCGSDDSGDDVSSAPAAEDTGTGGEDTGTGGEDTGDAGEEASGETDRGDAGPTPEACPDVGAFDGAIERQADDRTGNVAASLDGDGASDVITSEYFGLYSLYIADHPIDRAPLDKVLEGTISTGDAVLAGDAGVVATIGFGDVQGGSRLAVGDVVTTGTNDLTVIVDSGGGNITYGGDEDGSLEVLHVSDESICVTIDYSDPHVEVAGTVHAALYDGTN